MAKSELGKKITRAIEAVEKFVDDLKKDGKALNEALTDLGSAIAKEESGE